jgi:two-component system sensor histidine kinase VicK
MLTDPSQDRFRTVFENSPLGQKIIDSDLVIRQANSAVLAMLGLTHPDELVGHQILEFTHPHYHTHWHDLQERLWKHKMPHFRLETCLVRADGSSFWCQVNSILFPDEGGELGYSILEDITERKEIEEANKRLYDAQESILHLVAHDLRAPLANIQLLTDLVERNWVSPALNDLAHDTPGYLALIKRSCDEAETMLRDMLYLAAFDADHQKKERTNLNTFLKEWVDLHHIIAEEKGISLTLAVPTEMVYANIHQDNFRRALDNLFTNALKFTPTKGSISVGLTEHEGRPRLTVQDTGIGIPDELQPHIFDKFSPTRRNGLSNEPSTGLGLFIARQVVKRHGGKLWLESSEQKGTCFFIDLN